MSQSVREFVRQSGVEVQTPNSNSNSNNEFARELEMELMKADRERERTSFMRTPPRQIRPVPRQVQIPERLRRNLVNNRTYEGAFKEFENNSPFENEFDDLNMNNLAREFDEVPVGNIPLEISKLNPGMFNATVDSGFGQKDVLVKIKNILLKTPLPKTPIGEGLYVDTVEIKGIYGQFTTGFSHTREAGPKGDINKDFFSAQLMLTLSNGIESKGATVNIYRNGKIRFSGGFVGTNIENQPELIRRYIVDRYTEKQPFFYNQFTYNNLSGQFRVNGVFNSLTIIARNARKYGMTRVNYEPELSPFLYAYFGDNKFILSTSGNVQISGAKNPGDMARAYDFGKKFIRDLYSDDQINVTGVFDEGVKPKAKAKAKAPKPHPSPSPSPSLKKRILNVYSRRIKLMQ
jgi:TATA-box binding protein (TBP) (component of TFIID and TFIIIB)